jgi:ribose transport system permease protein
MAATMSNSKEDHHDRVARGVRGYGVSLLRSGELGTWVQRLSLPIAWGIVVVLFTIVEPGRFATTGNFSGIFGPQAPLVVLSLGLLLPLVAGEYDLSVAGTLGLSSMTIAVLNAQHGMGIGISILIGLCIGLVVGVVNAIIVVRFSVNSFIVTLGVSTLEEGLILWIANGQTVTGVSNGLVNIMVNDSFLGMPLEFYFALIVCVVVWYVLEKTVQGKRALFIGHGREVARLNGVPVDGLRMALFVASGVIAGVAGVLYVGRSGSADPTSAQTLLLPAFAAAFLGATAIKPGRFNAWGTVISVYFLVTGVTGLEILGVPLFISYIFYGVALVVAVIISQTIGARADRRRPSRLRLDRGRAARRPR